VFSVVMMALSLFVGYQAISSSPPPPEGKGWNASMVGAIVMMKNEALILERLLHSLAPHAQWLFVCDTGSTDGTQELAARTWKQNVETRFIGAFHNFETSRNLCMDAARSWMPPQVEWLLLPDADFTLGQQPGLSSVVMMPREFDLNIMQIRSTPNNALPLIVRASTFFGSCRYRLWTHEVLDCCNATTGYYSSLYWVDHSDGSSRPGKLVRDINLLEEWIYHYNKTLSPAERRQDLYARALYYLARAHEDAGHPEQALDLYRIHQLNQPWTNYQFQGLYRMALIKLSLYRAQSSNGRLDNDWRPVEAALLDAYGGPDGYFRREVLYYLMWMFSELHQWNRCILYAAAGLSAPPVDHSRMPLFLEPEKYEFDLFQKGLDHCVYQSKNSPLGQ
jgi:glycosyltransferase involved in cell wall biosynthesis